jgi:MFS family permease
MTKCLRPVPRDPRVVSTISPARRRLTFTVLAAATTLYTTSLSLVTPVLAQVRENLHTTQDGATWVLTSYLVSSAVLTPICGRLGDLFGKKRMLAIALLASTIGLVIAALATSLTPMIVGRVVQGLGGGIVPLAFGIARDVLPRERLGRAVGVISATTAVGAALGVVFAGPIVNGLGYHWLFWLPAIAAAATLAGSVVVIPASHTRAPGTVAWPAGILLAAWMVSLLVAISQGAQIGWSSPMVVAGAVGFVVTGSLWVAVELRSRSPLIDLRLLRAPTVWTTNLLTFLAGSAMFATMAFTTQLTQTPSSAGYGFGLSLTLAGLVQLPTSVSGFAAALTISRIESRVEARRIAMVCAILVTAGLLGLAFAHGEVWHICVANALTGAGLGGLAACQATLISAAVEADQVSAANGVTMTIRVIGGTIGTAVMSSVLAEHVSKGAVIPLEAGYTIGFAVLAGTVALSLAAALFIPSTLHRQTNPSHRSLVVPLGGVPDGEGPGFVVAPSKASEP